jgi:hypothetical protein
MIISWNIYMDTKSKPVITSLLKKLNTEHFTNEAKEHQWMLMPKTPPTTTSSRS